MVVINIVVHFVQHKYEHNCFSHDYTPNWMPQLIIPQQCKRCCSRPTVLSFFNPVYHCFTIIQHMKSSVCPLISTNEQRYNISQISYAQFVLCCVLFWLAVDRFNPYVSGLHHWHSDNRLVAPVSAKKSWRIWSNRKITEINDITKTKTHNTTTCIWHI